MNPYTDLLSLDLPDVANSVDEMVRERRQDIKDYDNLNNRFISGRKVGTIPTGATDVNSGDKAGDFNYDADYIYILVDLGGGNAEWRRAALGSW